MPSSWALLLSDYIYSLPFKRSAKVCNSNVLYSLMTPKFFLQLEPFLPWNPDMNTQYLHLDVR